VFHVGTHYRQPNRTNGSDGIDGQTVEVSLSGLTLERAKLPEASEYLLTWSLNSGRSRTGGRGHRSQLGPKRTAAAEFIVIAAAFFVLAGCRAVAVVSNGIRREEQPLCGRRLQAAARRPGRRRW
jgi:hypothetical protein